MDQTRPSSGSGYASLTDDDVITGEAVALDLPGASLATRAVSALIDALVVGLTMVACILVLVAATTGRSGAIQHIGTVLVSVISFLVLPTTVETLTRGRSLGKLAMGLRVIRDDGGPIGFQHAFVRALIGFVELYAMSGVPAFLSAMFSTRGKRLGDYAAGTYVITERSSLPTRTPLQMPPGLAQWAARADIAAPDVALAISTRQLLRRWNELTPASREISANSLATRWSVLVAPQPPPGAPAVAVLTALMVARREADLARLAREEDLRRRVNGAGSTAQGQRHRLNGAGSAGR